MATYQVTVRISSDAGTGSTEVRRKSFDQKPTSKDVAELVLSAAEPFGGLAKPKKAPAQKKTSVSAGSKK
jgi:hypothetical protein